MLLNRRGVPPAAPELVEFPILPPEGSKLHEASGRIRRVSRRPTRRVHREFEGRVVAVGAIAGRGRSTAASWHGRRAQSILEPGQPVDRFLCGQSVENGAGERGGSGRPVALVRVFRPRTAESLGGAPSGTWSSQDIVVFGPSSDGNLYQINMKRGGMPTPVTTPVTTPASLHRRPSFLPDGQHFLYLSGLGTKASCGWDR